LALEGDSKRYQSDQIMKMKCVENGTGMRITETCTGFLVKEPGGEKPLGETICRWEDNIKV